MSDSDNNYRPPVLGPFSGIRRSLFILGALFVAWVVFGHAAPGTFAPPHRPEAAPKDARTPLQPEAPQAKDEPDDLHNRIDQLEAKVKTMEDVIAASPKPAADIAAANSKIAALEAKIEALQQERAEPSVDDKRVTQIEDTLHKQEENLQAVKTQLSDVQAKATRQLASLTAFGQMRDAVLRGDPFTGQFDQINRLAQGNARALDLLAQLKPYTVSGSPTLAALQGGFESTIPKALAASEAHESALAKGLHSLIRIRKIGEQPGNNDEAVIARAETRLNRGEVEAASTELAALSSSRAAAFATWVKQAKDYLNIRATLDSLQLALAEDEPQAPPVATVSEPVPAPVPAPAAKPAPEPAAKPVPEATPEPAPATKSVPDAPPEPDSETTSEPAEKATPVPILLPKPASKGLSEPDSENTSEPATERTTETTSEPAAEATPLPAPDSTAPASGQ